MGAIEKRGPEKGLALVSVLWALSILSLIAAAVLSSSVLSYKMERNAWGATEAHMIANAAVNRAVLGLLDQRPEKRWRADGVGQTFVFEGTAIDISITDELGKIDINTASDDLLRGLFHAVVGEPVIADKLTDNVLDWRSSTGLKHLNASNEADHEEASDAYPPRHGPFQSVDELKLVPEMTPDLFAKLAPALTVYSHRPTVDPQLAPALVLRALPGMDGKKADEITAARAANAAAGGTPSLGFGGSTLPLAGRAFSIRIAFQYADRPETETVVIRLTSNPAESYWVLDWE